MFCFTRSKKWGKVIPLLRNGVHWWVSLLKLASFQVRLRSPMLTHLVIAFRHAHRCWLQQWVDERMRVPTPCNFFMLEKKANNPYKKATCKSTSRFEQPGKKRKLWPVVSLLLLKNNPLDDLQLWNHEESCHLTKWYRTLESEVGAKTQGFFVRAQSAKTHSFL